MSNQAQHYTIRVEQVAWSVEQPLGLFLEDIYSEGGDHAEPAEAGEIKIFKDGLFMDFFCDRQVVG